MALSHRLLFSVTRREVVMLAVYPLDGSGSNPKPKALTPNCLTLNLRALNPKGSPSQELTLNRRLLMTSPIHVT